MILDKKLKLFISYLLTLVCGTYLVFKSGSPILWFGAFYSIALYFLSRTSLSPNFFISSETNRFHEVIPEIVLLGKALPTVDKEDLKEERYLDHFEVNKVVKRQFFAYFFLALAIIFLTMKGNFEINLDTMIPVICGFLIIRSIYIGHLLVPLLINIVAAVINFESDLNIVFYVLYTFLILLTLRLMSQATGDHLKLGRTSFLVLIVVVFIGSVYGMSAIYPENSPIKNQDTISTKANPVRKALRLARSRSEKVKSDLEELPSDSTASLKEKIDEQLATISDLEKNMGKGNPLLTKKIIESALKNATQYQDEISEIQNKMLNIQNKPESIKGFEEKHSGDQAVTIQNLSKSMEKNQEALTKMLNNTQSLSTESGGAGTNSERLQNIKELSQKAEELKKQYEEILEMTPKEREDLSKHLKEKMNDLIALQKKPNLDKEIINEQKKNLDNLEELVKKSRPSMADLKEMAEGVKKSDQIDKMKLEAHWKPAQKLEHIQEQDKIDLNLIKALDTKNNSFSLKQLLPILVLGLLFIVVMYVMNKKGVKEIKIIDPELLNEFKMELKMLRKQKFSYREEVIHYYNLLHDILQRVHYTEHETPPSGIVYEDMLDFNPKLDKATFVVTEIYTKCFYGNKEVTLAHLKHYRKGMNAIMNLYGMSL